LLRFSAKAQQLTFFNKDWIKQQREELERVKQRLEEVLQPFVN